MDLGSKFFKNIMLELGPSPIESVQIKIQMTHQKIKKRSLVRVRGREGVGTREEIGAAELGRGVAGSHGERSKPEGDHGVAWGTGPSGASTGVEGRSRSSEVVGGPRGRTAAQGTGASAVTCEGVSVVVG